MIPLSATATSALTGSWRGDLRVQSWLGGQLLDADIPVSAGSEEVDRSLRVPERVTLTVPRIDRGTSYDPVDADAPLAALGQRLVVSLGVGLAGGRLEWFRRGEYLVTGATLQGDSISVQAAGLLQLIDEADLVSPFQPSGTIGQVIRALVEPALTVSVDPGLVDRTVPAGLAVNEDRLQGVLDALAAWPADATVTPDGVLAVHPAGDPTSAVLALTDGAGGTVLHWSGESTRDGAANVIVARGTASDGGQVQGVAYDTAAASPTRYRGPFSPLPVPALVTNQLLTTVAQCNAAAATELSRRRRASARKVTAELVPHPGLQAGDGVAVTGRGLVGRLCCLETYSLPLVPGSGSATGTLRVVG